MAACPGCSNELVLADGTLFCGACRASLQSRRALATSLGVRADAIAPVPDRFAVAAACPACGAVELRPSRAMNELVPTCGGCGASWVTASQLTRMRAHAAREAARSHVLPVETEEERAAAVHHVAFDDRLTSLFAYPAALVIGVLAHLIGLSFLVWATVEMWFHELGHAVIAWLGGFVAVPLPFFTTIPRETRSVWVILIVVGMIGAIAYEAGKRRRWGFVAFAGALAALQITLTLVLNPAQALKWAIFSGQAGAIVLPALVMWAFYQPLAWRWDFWRYVALPVASVGLVHALFIWIGVARGTGVMPHGSAIGDDSQGDMERLVREHGWTLEGLARAYLGLSIACLVALAITYAVFVRRARLVSARG